MTSARNEPASRRGLLPRWPAVTRPEIVGDLPIAAVLLVLTVFEAFVNQGTERAGVFGVPLTITVGVIMVLLVVPLRRRAPVVAMTLGAIVGIWFGVGTAVALVTSYNVGYRVARARTVVLAVLLNATIPMVIGWYFVLRNRGPEYELNFMLVFSLVLGVVPAMLGRYTRQRSALIAAGWEHAQRLEREHAMVVEQAQLRERSRIAQDMHDSLGHELSMIALQAGALELDPVLPERQRETAKLLRSTTSDAVHRLREIVGVLRDETEPAPTDPVAEGVSALVERARGSGVEIRYEEAGADGAGTLPPMTDRAIYRVVQESLTNATKHAPGAAVTVSLGYGDDVVVEITNAPPAAGTAADSTGGRGLIGLAERVRLAGGRLTAGPLEDGGFGVSARLPRQLGTTLAAEPSARPEGLPRLEPSAAELARFADYPSGAARLRRSFWFKLVAPLVGLIVVAAAYVGYAGLQMATMHESRYAALHVGDAEQDLRRTVPAGTPDPPAQFGPVVDEPKGQQCRYYVPRYGPWWDFSRYRGTQVYRLCYADGKLASRVILQQTKATE